MIPFKLSLMTLFHPIIVTEYIKKHREDKRFNPLPIAVMLILMIGVRVFSIYVTHYPLSTVSVRNANLVLEIGKLLVPVLTWVLASYAMTTILDGETLFSETLLFSAYALTPYVLFTVPLTLLSRLLDLGQSTLYHGAEAVLLCWVVFLMILALKEMNGYTIRKTLLVVVLSLFTMAVIWATVVLLFTIVSQFVTMLREVYYEALYHFI